MTPQLRFPEFTDEWQVKILGDIAPLQRGFDLPNSQQMPGKYPIVFSNGAVKTHDEYKAEAPGVVTGRSGTIGKVHYIEQDYWPHNTSLWVTDFKGNSPKYIHILYTRLRLERFSGGSGVPTLNRNDVHAHSIAIPSNAEQEKIAEFLTAVDERVALQDKKVELLQKYKKSVMQKIFSQKIRFKDESGNNYPDWKEKKLNEIGAVIGGGTPDTSNLAYWGGVVRWLTPTEVKSRFITKSKKSITEAGLKHSSAKMLPVGAIIFTSRATVGDIAISKVPLATNQGFQSIVVLDDNDSRYIYYWMIVNKNVFLRKASGSTFPEISSSEMKKINIQLPCIEEQKKIYSLLTLCDDKIDIEKTKLIEAKKFKKALLQRMFV